MAGIPQALQFKAFEPSRPFPECSPPLCDWGRLFFHKWFRRGPLRRHGIPSSTGGISEFCLQKYAKSWHFFVVNVLCFSLVSGFVKRALVETCLEAWYQVRICEEILGILGSWGLVQGEGGALGTVPLHNLRVTSHVLHQDVPLGWHQAHFF